jgi:hypothetical protein
MGDYTQDQNKTPIIIITSVLFITSKILDRSSCESSSITDILLGIVNRLRGNDIKELSSKLIP